MGGKQGRGGGGGLCRGCGPGAGGTREEAALDAGRALGGVGGLERLRRPGVGGSRTGGGGAGGPKYPQGRVWLRRPKTGCRKRQTLQPLVKWFLCVVGGRALGVQTRGELACSHPRDPPVPLDHRWPEGDLQLGPKARCPTLLPAPRSPEA